MLVATVRGSGQSSHAELLYGLTSTSKLSASAVGARILTARTAHRHLRKPDFTSPRVAKPRHDNFYVKRRSLFAGFGDDGEDVVRSELRLGLGGAIARGRLVEGGRRAENVSVDGGAGVIWRVARVCVRDGGGERSSRAGSAPENGAEGSLIGAA